MKPPAPTTTPLSSEELEKDAAEAGVASDQSTGDGSDPHLPASEGELAGKAEGHSPTLERNIAELPPG